MSRTTGFYIVLFGAAGLALWGIMAAGKRLRPPRDLSGIWHVRGDTTDVESGEVVRISQSGRFITVTLGDRGPMEFRWAGEERDRSGDVIVRLRAERHSLLVRILPPRHDRNVLDAADFVLAGTKYQVWRAERRGPEAPLPIEPRGPGKS